MRIDRSLFVALALLLGAHMASAVMIAVQSPTGAPGDTVEVCVFMTGSEGQVSGFQLDMAWPSDCLSVNMGSGDEAACTQAPGTGRDTFRTKVAASGASMRALMFSISDPSPMPAEVGQLFCCPFQIISTTGGRTCPLALSYVITSDAKGNKLPTTPVPGVVTVTADSGGSQQVGPGGSMGVVPQVITGGGQAVTGSSQHAPSGGGQAVAPRPALPAAPAMPGMPSGQMPEAPSADTNAATTPQVTPASTAPPQRAGTPARTPGHGTPAAKAGTPSAKAGTPQAEGTPTPAPKQTGAAGTPTPKGHRHKKGGGHKQPPADDSGD